MNEKTDYFNDLNAFCEKYDRFIRVVFLLIISAILIAIYGYLQQVEVRCQEAQLLAKRCDNYCRMKYFIPNTSNNTLFFNLTNKDT